MLSFFLQRCSSPEKKAQDFVGLWKSTDGAEIDLRADGSYKAKQIDYYKVQPEKGLENKKIDFAGQWKFSSEGKAKIELQTETTFKDLGIDKTFTYNGEVRSHRLGLTLEISGEGIMGNKLPWYLFVWIGDPDNGDKYKFVKSQL